MEYAKVGEVLEVTESVKTQYNYSDLVAQKANLTLKLTQVTASLQAEIAKVDKLIVEADKLGIKAPEAVEVV